MSKSEDVRNVIRKYGYYCLDNSINEINKMKHYNKQAVIDLAGKVLDYYQLEQDTEKPSELDLISLAEMILEYNEYIGLKEE